MLMIGQRAVALYKLVVVSNDMNWQTLDNLFITLLCRVGLLKSIMTDIYFFYFSDNMSTLPSPAGLGPDLTWVCLITPT